MQLLTPFFWSAAPALKGLFQHSTRGLSFGVPHWVSSYNPGRLSQKVALVTGGSSGIGRASALLFARFASSLFRNMSLCVLPIVCREGAQVLVADLDSEGGEKTVATIREQGPHYVFCSNC